MNNQNYNQQEQIKKCKLCQSDIPKKAIKCPQCQGDLRNWAAKHPILTVIGVLFLLSLTSSLSSESDNSNISNSPSSQTNLQSSISERKSKLGIDYSFVIERKMQRAGKHFSAVIIPSNPKPTTDQLKGLGEIVRDEYSQEPFVIIYFYDDRKFAEMNNNKYNEDNDNEFKILQNIQSHMIAQYNKNNASGLHQLEIYPQGFTNTKSEDIVSVNY